MRLLVLDNYESFTLFPRLQKRLDTCCELFKMGNIYTEQMWQIFKRVAPDVVFVDFCDQNAVNLTNRISELPNRPKIVVRLHGYEAQSWFIQKVDWMKVDHLIVVSPKFREIVLSKNVLTPNVGLHVVHNAIDTEKYELQSEFDDSAVAYVGYLNKKKGPGLLRTVMASMPDRRFHVGGVHQDEQVRLYFEHLALPNVEFHGWVDTSDFLKGKRFILSTSVTESFGMSIAEGMSMGLTPLVHAWPGAELLWPKECIWSTFDELKNIEPKDPAWCREWIEQRYPLDSCIDQVQELLLDGLDMGLSSAETEKGTLGSVGVAYRGGRDGC